MSDRPLTLSMLGGLEAEASGLPASPADREELLQGLRKAATFEGLATYDISERLLDFVGGSLQKPIASIMGEVWSQRKELREIAKKGKGKRDIESNVELCDHSMSCALHPSVELQVDGVTLGKLTFDVEANLKLQGVQLVIKNAQVTRIKAGKLISTFNLKCKTVPLMPPRKKTIDLPMSIDLRSGGIQLGAEPKAPAPTESPAAEP